MDCVVYYSIPKMPQRRWHIIGTKYNSLGSILFILFHVTISTRRMQGLCYAQACTITGSLWKIKMTFSSPPGEGLGAVKSTSWKDILKTRCWRTDVTDGKPLVAVPVTRALRELLRKGSTSRRAKQSHERPEGLTLRTVHCISLSQIWEWLSPVQLFATPWTVAHQAPWSRDFPGMNTGVGCHSLLQGIFPTQGSNPGLPHCKQTPYHLSYQESMNKEVEVNNIPT